MNKIINFTRLAAQLAEAPRKLEEGYVVIYQNCNRTSFFYALTENDEIAPLPDLPHADNKLVGLKGDAVAKVLLEDEAERYAASHPEMIAEDGWHYHAKVVSLYDYFFELHICFEEATALLNVLKKYEALINKF